MPLSDALLPEFDHEIASTRALLTRIPDVVTAWKPHPRSTSMGDLAHHIASIVGWIVPVLTQDELDLAPRDGAKPPGFTSMAATIAVLDANVAGARVAIAATPDSAMGVPWTLKAAGHVVFTQPRAMVLRSFVLGHLIHHRGQLTVYVRMHDIPLPSVYGPTADARS
jgi:uncharacterized damage-inducible protein DinB